MIMKLIFMNFIYYLILVISSLISVAFLVLLERKVLGGIQYREGPGVVSLMEGVLQSVSDAIKLFSKENMTLLKNYSFFYFLSPGLGMFLALMILLSVVGKYSNLNFSYSMLFIMGSLSGLVYVILYAGWASNSNYSMLGGIRGVVQTLSYEIVLFFIFISLFIYPESYSILEFYYYESNISLIFINWFMFVLFFLVSLVDLNRIPFDFVEGESELVSGFNTEYMSGGFALFFLSEYLLVLIFGIWIYKFFFEFDNLMILIFFMLVYLNLIILIRGALPRFRYDKLMKICWFELLPFSMIMYSLMVILKYFYTMFI